MGKYLSATEEEIYGMWQFYESRNAAIKFNTKSANSSDYSANAAKGRANLMTRLSTEEAERFFIDWCNVKTHMTVDGNFAPVHYMVEKKTKGDLTRVRIYPKQVGSSYTKVNNKLPEIVAIIRGGEEVWYRKGTFEYSIDVETFIKGLYRGTTVSYADLSESMLDVYLHDTTIIAGLRMEVKNNIIGRNMFKNYVLRFKEPTKVGIDDIMHEMDCKIMYNWKTDDFTLYTDSTEMQYKFDFNNLCQREVYTAFAVLYKVWRERSLWDTLTKDIRGYIIDGCTYSAGLLRSKDQGKLINPFTKEYSSDTTILRISLVKESGCIVATLYDKANGKLLASSVFSKDMETYCFTAVSNQLMMVLRNHYTNAGLVSDDMKALNTHYSSDTKLISHQEQPVSAAV